MSSFQNVLVEPFDLAFQDFLYHAAIFVFYFGTFLLQAATTSLHAHNLRSFMRTNTTFYEPLLNSHEYNLSVAATVSIMVTCSILKKQIQTLY